MAHGESVLVRKGGKTHFTFSPASAVGNDGDTLGVDLVFSESGGKLYFTKKIVASWVKAASYPIRADVTLTLQPDAAAGEDTHLRDNQADNNFGANNTMVVGENKNVSILFRGLIKFDLSSIPSNATIDDATLSMWPNDHQADTDGTFKLYRSLRVWTEGGATWNKYDGTNSWGTAGGFNASDHEQTEIASLLITAPPSIGAQHDWTITPAKVQDWIDGTLTNNGMMIKTVLELNDQINWKSSDFSDASQRPRLVVNYTPALGATDEEGANSGVF